MIGRLIVIALAGEPIMLQPGVEVQLLEDLESGKIHNPWTVEMARNELHLGNERYKTNHHQPPTRNPKKSELSQVIARTEIKLEYADQVPLAVVLCCADSRACLEIVFDQKQGQLFVVRTAGNTPDDKAIANVAYALQKLHVPLVVVMGHQECGAVFAALSQFGGSPPSRCFAAFVDPILPHVKPQGTRPDLVWLEETVRDNVAHTATMLRADRCLRSRSTPPIVDEAYYRFTDGHVDVRHAT